MKVGVVFTIFSIVVIGMIVAWHHNVVREIRAECVVCEVCDE